MSMQNVMAALAVSYIEAASAWYTKLLGLGLTEEPMAGLLEWEFPRRVLAPNLRKERPRAQRVDNYHWG